MTTRKEYSLRNTPIHPFVFRQRKEKLDWRRLASIDVNQVINEMDVGTLQDVLSSVAFCDITCEVDIRYVDGNLIKLFQLAQLLVEYLLHSQSYLISSVNSLKEENASLQKNLSSAKQDLAEKMNKLTAVRRECHRRRLLLLAQQQLMDSGPQSYHRCLYCPKAFLNASFLAAHVQRRHPETENIRHLPTLIAECGSQNNPLMAETVHIQTNSVQTNAMEKDVRDLLACLRSTSSKPEAGIPDQNKQFGGKLRHVTTHNGILDEFACKEVNATEENEKSDWKMAEEYRQELEALKRIFENELRDLRKQYEVTQADLAELKAKPAMSDVGEIVDDAAKVSSKKHPTKGAPTDYEATVKESVSPDETFHQPYSIMHSKGQKSESEPTITNENEALASPTLEMGSLKTCDHRNIMPLHSKQRVPIFRLKQMIPIQENVIYGPHIIPEDSDDKAESDITVPVRALSPCDCTRRSLRVRSTNPSFVDGCEDELDECLLNLGGVRKCQKNKRLKCAYKNQFTCRKTKHVRKRIRSTAIQVGLEKNSKLSVSEGRSVIRTNGMQDNSIFLKVRRKYSRSGSSTATHRSPSPTVKQLTDRFHGFSREIVIVRTDDEEIPSEQTHRGKSETTASIQLMPLVCSENASCVAPHRKDDSVLSVRRVGVSATGLPSNLLPQEHPIVCDRSQIQASMGRMFERSEPKISKFSRQSSEHLSASFDGDSIYHLLKMHPVETDRPAFDNTRKTFKKALLGYEDSGGENKHEPVFDSTVLLPTTTCASTHPSNQNLDSSLLRHRRLLEQLRTDPQTIQGLRHEVERILNEHLVERNINIDQTRLSTSKFNEYLGALNRDRVHLCRKHLNFTKTREALAQHVDRLARAALSGRSGDRMASSIFCAGSQQSVKGRSLSRSRLPPSGVYSLGCVHQSSVPHSTQQHTNIHSRVGQSLPTLTGPEQEVQHFGISPFRSTGSIGLTQHRPQTRRYDPQIDTSSDTRADHQSLSSRGSSDRPGRSSRHSRFAATAQHSASHHHSGGSTSTFSPRTSLATYFSHDRRVVTFGPGRSDGKNITDTSNDNWNSSKEDLQNPVGRVERKLPIPDERTKGIGDNNEHDNDIRVISQSRPWQSNTNAHFTVPSAGGSTPGKVQSTRTDEEDVFSVSSINGNGNDQNSLEFNHETPHKQDADLFGACCSIDQSVIEAHAQSAALGPRPTTRFGSTDRQAP